MQRSWMMWIAVGLIVPALALGCRQSRSYTGGGAGTAFPPPMLGAKAPARSGEFVIPPSAEVTVTQFAR